MTITAAMPSVKISRRRVSKRQWIRSPKVIAGVIILLVFLVIAVIGPWISPYNPSATSSAVLQGPSGQHLLGTTALGEDVLSQVLTGTRLSLEVGFLAAIVSELIAIVIGVTSGFLGGIADEFLSLFTNVFIVIPVLPLQILIIAYIGTSSWVLTALVIAITAWSHGARKLRAQALSIRKRDYVEAARNAGEPTWRIVWVEVLPNLSAIVTTNFLFSVLAGIIVQTGLAFLGLGDVTSWSWGAILHWSENGNAFLTGAWWWYVPPGICLALIGMGLAMINLGIDEVVNPRLRGVGQVRQGRAIAKANAAKATAEASGARAARTARVGEPRTILDISDLWVDYGSQEDPLHALRGVSLSLRRGEILGLAGESGSGKSTLGFAVTRLLRSPGRVAKGAVTYFGRTGGTGEELDVLGASDEQLRRFRWEEMAVVFQAAMNSLNPVLTVRTQLEDTIRSHRPQMTKTARRARASELMELVGIDPSRLNSYAFELSGGQRQRVMIAMALALEPAIVILDEPTTSLDVVVQRDILRCIVDLQKRLDSAFVFITHDLSLLLEVADRIAVMYGGEIVELATSQEIMSNPLHPYTKKLLESFPTLRGPRKTLGTLGGAAPSLRSMPSGCAFHPRCPVAVDACRIVDPPLLSIQAERDPNSPGTWIEQPAGDDQKVACLVAQEQFATAEKVVTP
ncbi:MAG TPA: dipeptide/oligopeptide/nickel ABC transporter permease/ATP-binding protein [Leifsonia sp.]|nr:dipeptide/oligopeptide/nickel ABC transporter permease/ATP-binding protein [Leifsonia sp.]